MSSCAPEAFRLAFKFGVPGCETAALAPPLGTPPLGAPATPLGALLPSTLPSTLPPACDTGVPGPPEFWDCGKPPGVPGPPEFCDCGKPPWKDEFCEPVDPGYELGWPDPGKLGW